LRGVKFGLRKIVETASQIAAALAAAHAAGIVHRDLKPDNVLLTRAGCVKILDFGLAKTNPPQLADHEATETLSVRTEPGVVMGTIAYMSPEQVSGITADHRSDIFSFGVLLYELLAGTRPFQGETPVDTMQAILRKDPPELTDAVPVGLRQIVEMGVLAGAPMLLIAMQPDMGTALTYVPIYLAALLLGGLRWKLIAAVMLLGVLAAPVGWGHLKAYQKERILTVFQPERDPAGVGYQVRQSKIAIGSGKFTGKGLFHGTQSHLNFLPAQHTDFVLSVLSEEFGFMGAAIVLSLFYYVLHRGILAARSAQDRLGTYLCLLVVAWIVGQVGVNVGMVLGLLPTIGVPLPFLSYGGSALLAAMAGIGLVANVRGRRIVN